MRSREHAVGWAVPCPDRHASDGFSVLIRADELAGRYRFECVEARDGDLCGSERDLVRLLGLGESEVRIAAEGVAWSATPWPTFRDASPDEPRWLIDGLLPEGALAFVAGPPKQGKTWIGLGARASRSRRAGRCSASTRSRRRAPCSTSRSKARGTASARASARSPAGSSSTRTATTRPAAACSTGRGPSTSPTSTTAAWLLERRPPSVEAALVVVDVLRAAARFKENVAEDFARIRDALRAAA